MAGEGVMGQLKLQIPESRIAEFAKRYQDQEPNLPEEKALMGLRSAVQRQGFLDRATLRRIAKWKAPRTAGYTERNGEGYVKEITAWSLAAKDERARIEVLRLLDGVDWPTASVILHFFHEDRYPILDFRALWSVGVDNPEPHSFERWWRYVVFCREVADRNHVEMRTLDRALWQFSKDRP
jgi:hypothetical protein